MSNTPMTARTFIFLSADLQGATRLKQCLQEIPDELRASLGDTEEVPHDTLERIRYFRTLWVGILDYFFETTRKRFFYHWNIEKEFFDDERFSEIKDYFIPNPGRENEKTFELKFWKLRGDEILFFVEVESVGHILSVLRAWTKVLVDLNKNSLSPDNFSIHHAVENLIKRWVDRYNWVDDDRHIIEVSIGQSGYTAEIEIPSVKGSAWLSVVHYPDHEYVVKTLFDQNVQHNSLFDILQRKYRDLQEYLDHEKRVNSYIDFIGPKIDTGFRIAEFASPNNLVVSVDLMYVLSISFEDLKEFVENYKRKMKKRKKILGRRLRSISLDDFSAHTSFEVRFLGRRPLKGVAGSRSYPIFALTKFGVPQIDEFDGDSAANKVEIIQTRETIKSYCEEFMKISGISRPYLSRSSIIAISKLEDDVARQIKAWENVVASKVSDVARVTQSVSDAWSDLDGVRIPPEPPSS